MLSRILAPSSAGTVSRMFCSTIAEFGGLLNAGSGFWREDEGGTSRYRGEEKVQAGTGTSNEVAGAYPRKPRTTVRRDCTARLNRPT